MQDRRFIRVLSESKHLSSTEIWVDRETRVQYIYHAAGYSGGMSVLVDKDGKPLLMDERELYEYTYR